MAGFSDTISILIKADGAAAAREFKKVGDAASKELDRADKSSRDWGATLTKVGVGLTTTAAVGGVALYRLGQDASDLAETMSKSERIFGSAAGEVSKFGDSAADSLGQSKKSAVDAVAGFGALAKGVGLSQDAAADFGIQFATLASDMASFANTSPEEAILAIGSALRGESEPIRKYNVLLNETAVTSEAVRLGLVKQGDALNEQQKVQARASLIMQQTSDIQGDFARTSEGAANQQRILSARMDDLRAKIGAGVLPAMTSLLSTISGGVDAFASMNAATGGLIGGLATFGVGAAGTVGVISLVVGQTIKMKGALIDAGRGAREFAVGLKTAQGAGRALQIGALGVGVAILGKRFADAAREADEFADSVAAGGGKSPLDQLKAVRAELERQIEVRNRANGVEVGVFGVGGIGSQDYKEAADAVDGLTRKEEELVAVLEASGPAGQKALAAINPAPYRGFTSIIDRAAAGLRRSTVEQNRAERAAAGHGTSLRGLIGQMDRFTERTLGANDSTRDFASAQLDAADANARIAESQKAMNDAIAEYGEASPEAAQATRDYQRSIIDASQSQDDAKRAAVEHAQALSGYDAAGKNSEATNRKFRDSLREVAQTLAPGDPLRQYLLGYANELQSIPASKNTNVTVSGDALTTAQRIDAAIQAIRDRDVYVNIHERNYSAGGGVQVRAKGGPVEANEAYIVGEEGPELFLSNQSGVIIPNNKLKAATSGRPVAFAGRTQSAGGGDTIIINFNGPVASEREAERWVTNALHRARRRGDSLART